MYRAYRDTSLPEQLQCIIPGDSSSRKRIWTQGFPIHKTGSEKEEFSLIILMHDGGGDRSQTLAALPKIIETLLGRGYRFVTIRQLLSRLPHEYK